MGSLTVYLAVVLLLLRWSPAAELEGAVLGTPRATWLSTIGGSAVATATFAEDSAGVERVRRIEITLAADASDAAARDALKRFHPPDGRAVRVYEDGAGRTVEVFASDELARAFEGVEDGTLGGGRYAVAQVPGTYSQTVEGPDAGPLRAMLSLGHSP
ncbi:MAG: hypothetical protein U0821_19545 [Chloroflexota bacterium]